MPKSQKLPKLSVKCGTMLTRQPKTDFKRSIKRTSKLPPNKRQSISLNMARSRKRKKEKTKRNDS